MTINQNLTFDQIKQLIPNLETQLLEAQNNLSPDTIFYKDPFGGNYYIKTSEGSYHNIRYGDRVIDITTDGTHLIPIPYNPTTKQEFINFILSYPPALVYPSNRLFGIGDGDSMFGNDSSSYSFNSFKEGKSPVMQALVATFCTPPADTAAWTIWNSAKQFWCKTPSYRYKEVYGKEKLEYLNFDELLVSLSRYSSDYESFTFTFFNGLEVTLEVTYNPLLDMVYQKDDDRLSKNIEEINIFADNLLEVCETSDSGEYGKFYIVKHLTFGAHLFFASVDSWHDSNDPGKANVYLKYVGEIK